MNLDTLKASLIEHEGWRNTMYRDHLGNNTIGVGHLMSRPISDQAVEQILADDIKITVQEMDNTFPGWRDHDEIRQNVLVEMCFNMGAPRLRQFHRMWAALKDQDYATASAEMLKSRWYLQVGRRAETLAQRMLDGA